MNVAVWEGDAVPGGVFQGLLPFIKTGGERRDTHRTTSPVCKQVAGRTHQEFGRIPAVPAFPLPF